MSLLSTLLMACAFASEPNITLPFAERSANGSTSLRPIPVCRWAAKDLVPCGAPSSGTAGMGAVLRVKSHPQTKTLGPDREVRWTKTDSLTTYVSRNLLERYEELARRHPDRPQWFFYEDEAHVKALLESGRGFRLEPGTYVVSNGDVLLMRFLHGAPILDLRVLEPIRVDGEIVYRPTISSGALPMDVVEKSFDLVYGTLDRTPENECDLGLEE